MEDLFDYMLKLWKTFFPILQGYPLLLPIYSAYFIKTFYLFIYLVNLKSPKNLELEDIQWSF